MRPDLDKMTADWKRPRKSPSHFSVEDRIFIQASDRSAREPVRLVLWFTIVQPEGFSDFAPTCAFPVKQPNLVIHGGKSDRSSSSRGVSQSQNEKLLIQHYCPYWVLMADSLPTSHPAQNFQRDFIHGGNSAGKRHREAASIVE